MPDKRIILYAEDDLDDFMIVSDAMGVQADHIQIVHAGNGAKALEYLDSLPAEGRFPDLIILDLNMPVMDGKETLLHLKRSDRYHSIPVIIFTTSSHNKDRELFEQYEIPFITKPTSYKELKPIVQQFMGYCCE